MSAQKPKLQDRLKAAAKALKTGDPVEEPSLETVQNPTTAARRKLTEIIRAAASGDSGAGAALEAFEAERGWAAPMIDGATLRKGGDALAEAAPKSPLATMLRGMGLEASGDSAAARACFIDTIRTLRGRPDTLTPADANAFRAAAGEARLFHSFDLVDDFVDGSNKRPQGHAREMLTMRLPALDGKTVLDIGSWCGFYAFEAERRGAEKVVAMDYYTWIDRRHDNSAIEQEIGLHDIVDDPRLPGKKPIDAARQMLGSKVEAIVCPFQLAVEKGLPQFDVVLLLGVIYHARNPFQMIEYLAQVTKERAIVETAGTYVPGYENEPMWRFTPGRDLNNDPSNWWIMNEKGLEAMAKEAGFSDVRFLQGFQITELVPGELVDDGRRGRFWAEFIK